MDGPTSKNTWATQTALVFFFLKNMKLSGKGKRVNPVGVGVCEYDECMLSKFLKEIIFLNKLTFKAGHGGTCL